MILRVMIVRYCFDGSDIDCHLIKEKRIIQPPLFAVHNTSHRLTQYKGSVQQKGMISRHLKCPLQIASYALRIGVSVTEL